MRFFKLFLLAVMLIAIVGAGGMYFMAGREAGAEHHDSLA